VLWLSGGLLVDGTGVPPRPGDLLINGNRIEAVGPFAPPADAERIDCAGLVVSPGFIDAHSHSDLQVLESRPEKIRQGVTAEVVGNCGFSPYPTGDHPGALREFANGIFCGAGKWGWTGAAEYLAEARPGATTFAVSLVGHGSLRIAVAGHRLGPLSESAMDRMEGLLDQALSAGAAGFSTGLMYAPGSSAPFSELERLCRVVARRDAVYATHIRTYFGGLVDAIEEQLELARRTGCRLQISHLQAAGAANWPLQEPALERIEAARRNGLDVAFDCYPYTAGSTVLTQLLPQEALEGGISAMVATLLDRGRRAAVAAEIESAIPWRWSDIVISSVGSSANTGIIGWTLAQIAEHRGRPPVEVVFDLLVEERGLVNMLCINQSEDNLRATLTHPLSIIGSDGFYVKGRPHPRLHGTFPKLLGTYSRDLGWLSLEEAVHKITGAPAARFRLNDRGRLAPGFLADVTVFDPTSITSPATYEQSDLPPTGIRFVFREGRLLN
jgi:dihydroorotase/N-acyl-D-amino-acid deacylase